MKKKCSNCWYFDPKYDGFFGYCKNEIFAGSRADESAFPILVDPNDRCEWFKENVDLKRIKKIKLKKMKKEIPRRFNPTELAGILDDDEIEIQKLSDETIEAIIIDYLKRHEKEEVYPSDIAFAFNLDADQVRRVCLKLVQEGRLFNKGSE